jgi:hypothetical protein
MDISLVFDFEAWGVRGKWLVFIVSKLHNDLVHVFSNKI